MPTKFFAKVIIVLASACLPVVYGTAAYAAGDDSLKLSIAPPLFKVNMNPGETWASTLKIINNNSYAVTVFAQVMDFKSGQSGGVEFQKGEDGPPAVLSGRLSRWIGVTDQPIEVAADGSAEIPFTISLPPDADPGGHYAAILVGNKPSGETQGSNIKISSKLASLLLVRVSGDIVERGEIREFSADTSWSKKLEAGLVVRFANRGNVHLQPRGEIKITNMFGKTRSVIPINAKSDFGNVLPESEKKWEFAWKGESALFDAGRMRADLIFSYGEEAKHSEGRTIYFWTIDLKLTLAVMGATLALILIFIFSMRRYIRKSVDLARAQAGLAASVAGAPAAPARPEARVPETVRPPFETRVINLRGSGEKAEARSAVPAEGASWSGLKRRLIFSLLIVLALAGSISYIYFSREGGSGSKDDSGALETVLDPVAGKPAGGDSGPGGQKVEVVALEGATKEDAAETPASATETATTAPALATGTPAENLPAVAAPRPDKKDIEISVLNGSGLSGAAAKAAKLIAADGFVVQTLGNAENFNFTRTEVRYGKGLGEEAARIVDLLGGGTATEAAAGDGGIAVVLGKDFK